MTNSVYTAWDDNRYQWPPPEGWYQASDGRWWPEGYGPPEEQADKAVSAEPVVDLTTDSHESGQSEQPARANEADRASNSASQAGTGPSALAAGAAGAAGAGMVAAVSGVSTDTDPSPARGDAPSIGSTEASTVSDAVSDATSKAPDPAPSSSQGSSAPSPQIAGDRAGAIAEAAQTAEGAPSALAAAAKERVAEAAPGAASPDQGETGSDGSGDYGASKLAAAIEELRVGGATPSMDRPTMDIPKVEVDPEPIAPPLSAFPSTPQEAQPAVSPGFQPDPDVATPRRIDGGRQGPDGSAQGSIRRPDVAAGVGQAGTDFFQKPDLRLESPKRSKRKPVLLLIGVLALVGAGIAGFLAYDYLNNGGVDDAIGDDGIAVAGLSEETAREGEFESPYPPGQVIKIEWPPGESTHVWLMQAVAPEPTVGQEIAAASSGDGEALVGSLMVLVNRTESAETSTGQLRFVAVAADGDRYEPAACPAGVEGIPDAVIPYDTKVEGYQCWLVPLDDVPGLMLGVESTEIEGTVHVMMP